MDTIMDEPNTLQDAILQDDIHVITGNDEVFARNCYENGRIIIPNFTLLMITGGYTNRYVEDVDPA